MVAWEGVLFALDLQHIGAEALLRLTGYVAIREERFAAASSGPGGPVRFGVSGIRFAGNRSQAEPGSACAAPIRGL